MSLAAVLSVAIGLSLGLLGGGGSILAVPVLVHVVGLAAKPAIATSLLVVSAASLAAVVVHARAGRVRYRIGATFGAASMAGAFVGGRLSELLPDGLLLGGFTSVMIVTGIMMLRKRSTGAHGPRCISNQCTAVLGVGVGLLTGIVGAGGGFVVVPALAVLGGLSMPEAIATSLLVIGANSFAGFLGQIGHVSIDPKVATAVTVAAVIGSYAGASAARRFRAESLRRGFAVFVLGMAGVMAYGQLHARAQTVHAIPSNLPDDTLLASRLSETGCAPRPARALQMQLRLPQKQWLTKH
ncbi:MAG TPA: sulfite exporter TauE/SafE family protein [Polyangiaceae bacterium]|nr:sulfite exporter TauE/SafE family protein [Polyangiaceae bacterium]